MPLKSGTSKATVSQNIREFHKGPTYQRTLREHGKATADKQAIAAAMEKKRESARKK